MTAGAGLVLPLAAIVAAALVATSPRWNVRPTVAVRLGLAFMAVGAAAAVPVLVHLGTGALFDVPHAGDAIHSLVHPAGPHYGLGSVATATGLAWAAYAALRTIRVIAQHAALRARSGGGTAVDRQPEPYAHVLPGRGGRIVVSQGLLDLLDDAELDVVLAHEQAHSRLRHDRVLLATHLLAAGLPLMWPIARRISFALERIADEHAARRCGSREFVARTIAKVALSQHVRGPRMALGISSVGVAARTRALTARAPLAPRSVLIGAWISVVGTAALAALQWHHVVAAVRSVCGL